jgi:hypothetical protein
MRIPYLSKVGNNVLPEPKTGIQDCTRRGVSGLDPNNLIPWYLEASVNADYSARGVSCVNVLHWVVLTVRKQVGQAVNNGRFLHHGKKE